MSLKIVIVGGVAGGMSAATRARRMNEEASIIVLERNGFVSFANCGLPYYISGQIHDESSLLVSTPQKVRERFNIDARVMQEVTRIDRRGHAVEGVDRVTGAAWTIPYDKLILATGASPIIPPIEHVDAPNVMLLRSMEDTRAMQEWLGRRRPKTAVIVGAGFIGLEMAEALRTRGIAVTLIEKAPHVLPPLDAELCAPIQEELGRNGVEVIANDGLRKLHATGDEVVAVETGSGRKVPADLVLLSIGVRPNVSLAKEAELSVGPSGAVAVDAWQRTSDPDIYCVGDASEAVHGVTGKPARIPLAGPANRQGRTAGEHAAAGASPAAARVLGTAIVKVFDLSAAITGLGETAAKNAGFDVQTAYVNPGDHAGYYPGATPMRIKVIYERKSGRLLGAQAVGNKGIDKRIDVMATVIHFGGTIDDLAGLDLCYAPQFGSAKDAIHQAGMTAQNQRVELTQAISPAEINGRMLLDVRTPKEFAAGTLDGAINIPLDELRGRLGELKPDASIAIFCQAGQRGYVAQRILSQRGFKDVKNVKGGYGLARQWTS